MDWNKYLKDKPDWDKPPPAEVVGVQFGIFSSDEIERLSAVEVTVPVTCKTGVVQRDGVTDPRLGTNDRSMLCGTCGCDHIDCAAGHSGHIRLAVPVPNGEYLSSTHKILGCICINCCRLLLPPDLPALQELREIGNTKDRLKRISEKCKKREFCESWHQTKRNRKIATRARNRKTTFEEEAEKLRYEEEQQRLKGQDVPDEPDLEDIPVEELLDMRIGCGAQQPTWIRDANLMIRPVFTITEEQRQDPNYEFPVFTPFDMVRVLDNIRDDDVRLLGMDPDFSRPSSLIWQNLYVSPVNIRPSRLGRNSKNRMPKENDLTHRLKSIERCNVTLQEKLKRTGPELNIALYSYAGIQFDCEADVRAFDPQRPKAARSPPDPVAVAYEKLCKTIFLYQNDKLKPKNQTQYGRDKKSVRTPFRQQKQNRVRKDVTGKRMDFCARTVIGPSTEQHIREISIGQHMAMKMSYPEHVNDHNMVYLINMVRNGPDNYPGANIVIYPDGHEVQIDSENRHSIELRKGMTVRRHLINGDYVIANRQPSLHTWSMLAHRLRILREAPGTPMEQRNNTFELHLAVTPGYNADFDGDEANIKVIQGHEARAEASEIMLVDHNILKDDVPIIKFVQNSLCSAYMMTRDGQLISRANAAQMIIAHCTHQRVDRFPWTEFSPTMRDGEEHYTGHQVFSCILPKDFYLKAHGILIERGVLLRGQLSKKSLNGSGGIIHILVRDYGGTFAADFISGAYNFFSYFGCNVSSFTVALDDCHVPRSILGTEEIHDRVKKYFYEHRFHNLTSTNLNEVRQEQNLVRVADGMRDVMAERAVKYFERRIGPNPNGMMDLIESGAKGSASNMAQVSGCMGQQRNHESRRFPDATVHYHHPEADPAARHGLIASNFMFGMNPQETFHHLAAARSGLVDTAVKSVTYETEIIIIENGQPRRTQIGEWIDNVLERSDDVDVFPNQANMEYTEVDGVHITTMDDDGRVTWAPLTAVTRHDPSDTLYDILTQSGRSVTVVASKSLLVWDQVTLKFQERDSVDVHIGDFLPVHDNNLVGYRRVRDVLLDPIIAIGTRPSRGQKVYDVTVPSTLNFGLANGLQVRDTSRTGYMQRRIAKSTEDLVAHYGKVHNSAGDLIQLRYGVDGFVSNRLEHDIVRPLAPEQDWRELMRGADIDEHQTIAKLRAFVIGTMTRHMDNDRYPWVHTPVHLTRTMARIGTLLPSEPRSTHQEIKSWQHHMFNQYFPRACGNNPKLELYLRDHLSIPSLLHWPATSERLGRLMDEIMLKFDTAPIPHGQMVGEFAAQSIGEPLTQMTLNSFHASGQHSTLTTGVPRVREIINASSNPSGPSMTIFFEDKDTLMETAQRRGASLVQQFVSDYILFHEMDPDRERYRNRIAMFSKATVLDYPDLNVDDDEDNDDVEEDPDDNEDVEEDNEEDAEDNEDDDDDDPDDNDDGEDVEDNEEDGEDDDDEEDGEDGDVDMEEDDDDDGEPEEEPEDSHDEQEPEVSTVFQEDDSHFLLIIHIRSDLPVGLGELTARCKSFINIDTLGWLYGQDEMGLWIGVAGAVEDTHLLKWVNSMGMFGLNLSLIEDIIVEHVGNCTAHGIRGIKGFHIEESKYAVDNERTGVLEWRPTYHIVTHGTNLRQILQMPWVDITRTYSNDILETERLLGIDAARQLIHDEMMDVMANSGVSVRSRHISLLAERMTHRGVVLPTTYSGICVQSTSIMRNASFENPMDTFLQGALRGDFDPVVGMTECIITNRKLQGGTGLVRTVNQKIRPNPHLMMDVCHKRRSVAPKIHPPTGRWLEEIQKSPVIVHQHVTQRRQVSGTTSASRRRKRALTGTQEVVEELPKRQRRQKSVRPKPKTSLVFEAARAAAVSVDVRFKVGNKFVPFGTVETVGPLFKAGLVFVPFTI